MRLSSEVLTSIGFMLVDGYWCYGGLRVAESEGGFRLHAGRDEGPEVDTVAELVKHAFHCGMLAGRVTGYIALYMPSLN